MEQNTSPHNLSTQVPKSNDNDLCFTLVLVPGVAPAACWALPAVLVVAQGIEIQSDVQVVSPTITSPGDVGVEMEKLSDIECKGSLHAV